MATPPPLQLSSKNAVPQVIPPQDQIQKCHNYHPFLNLYVLVVLISFDGKSSWFLYQMGGHQDQCQRRDSLSEALISVF